MYIVEVKFDKNGHELDGFIHQNRHKEYYPSEKQSIIFESLLTAIGVTESLNEKYGFKYNRIIDINDPEDSEVKYEKTEKGIILSDYKSIIKIIDSILIFTYRTSYESVIRPTFYAETSGDEIEIGWHGIKLYLGKDYFQAVPESITTHRIESINLFYTPELLTNINRLNYFYRHKLSINQIIDAYGIKDLPF